jgi:hypothetical protein
MRDTLPVLFVLLAGFVAYFAPIDASPAALLEPGAETVTAGQVGGTSAGRPEPHVKGLRSSVRLLGEERWTLQAEEGRALEPELGPFSLGGAISGLALQSVTLEGPRGRLRAERGRLDSKSLHLKGAVRLDDAEGRGILFGPELVLARARDEIGTGQPVMLAPTAEQGGAGGRMQLGYRGSLRELIELAARQRRRR